MNANEIWSGQIYAHVDYISRGVTFYPNAKPVRILRVFKQTTGGERSRTMCEVILMRENKDGSLEHRHDTLGNEVTRTYRARDIYARWDEHVAERRRRKTESDEKERIRREETERRRKEYEERLARVKAELEERARQIEAEKQRLMNYIKFKGIPESAIKIVNGTEIIFDRLTFEEWLGMRKKVPA